MFPCESGCRPSGRKPSGGRLYQQHRGFNGDGRTSRASLHIITRDICGVEIAGGVCGGTFLLRTFAVAIVRGCLHRAVAHASVQVCKGPCSSTDRIEVS